MKLTTLLLVIVLVQASAKSFSQKINLHETNAPLTKVIKTIKQQSGYEILFVDQELKKEKISVQFTGTNIEEALKACFNNTAIEYKLVGKNIFLKKSETLIKATPLPPITVNGTVIDEKNQPFPSVTVTVKGTENRSITDTKGHFTLTNVDDNAILVFTFIGYKPKEVAAKSNLGEIQMEVQNSELQEVIVAYGKTTLQANTSSITVIKGEQIASLPNRSFEKSLQGLVPGLLVNKGSGQPGSATNNFVLRGIATGGVPDAGQSYRNPLVVIDGIPVYQDPLKTTGLSGEASESNPLAQFNPSDIETITVLKDASAVALYGSKASNGVILVTTKKGKSGKTIYTLSNQTDISERLQDPEVLNQSEYLQLLFEAYRNSTPGITDATIIADLKTKFPTQANGSFYAQPDWNAEYFRGSAITTANQLSMSGGSDRSNFYLNLEYTKQDGIIKATGFDRKSMRFNYENHIASWLKVGLNTTGSYTVQNYSSGSGNVLPISPLLPIRLSDGSYVNNYSWGLGTSATNFIANPILATELNIRRNTAYHGLSKLYGELKFLKDFTLTSNVGIDFALNEGKEKVHPKFVLTGETAANIGSIQDQTVRNVGLLNTNMLRYDKRINNEHSINLLVGQETQVITNKYMLVEMRGFSSNPTATEPQAGSTTTIGRSNIDKQTLLSYFGQANYSYREKYFLTGSIRTDGSSRFGDNHKFGTYWSVGGGWNVTNEPFMKSTSNFLNFLKLRGSFGASGNAAAIAGLLQYDRLQIAQYLGNPAVYPHASANPGNPDIQWEATFSWDAGIEAKFWDNRVTIIADKYVRKTTDLIAYNILLPAATGYLNLTDNIGDVKNSGLEFSVAIDLIKSKSFRWNINTNWSTNQSKLIKANQPQVGIANNLVNKVGEAFNSFYLPVWAGVNPANGRPQWINSTTGTPTENYIDATPQIVGKAQPDGFGAFTTSFFYHGFELSAMLYYQYGFQIYLNNNLQNDGLRPYINQTKDALNRWQKPGDIAFNPRRLLNGSAITNTGTITDQGSNASTRYLYDGDFMRLSNVALAYNVPKSILNRIGLSAMRIYLQGHNLATWTHYSGQDPENVNAQHRIGSNLYPQQKSYSLGINLNF